jgi:hypothetical protein
MRLPPPLTVEDRLCGASLCFRSRREAKVKWSALASGVGVGAWLNAAPLRPLRREALLTKAKACYYLLYLPCSGPRRECWAAKLQCWGWGSTSELRYVARRNEPKPKQPRTDLGTRHRHYTHPNAVSAFTHSLSLGGIICPSLPLALHYRPPLHYRWPSPSLPLALRVLFPRESCLAPPLACHLLLPSP